MELNFETYLKSNNIMNACDWNGAIVKKLEIYREARIWRFYIAITQITPARLIKETETQLKIRYRFLDRVEIFPVPPAIPAYLTAILKTREDDLSSLLFNGEELSRLKTDLAWSINNSRLDLRASDLDSYNLVLDHEICTHLSDWLWEEYRLRMVARVSYDLNMPPCSENEEEHYITKREINIIENTETEPQNGNPNRRERNKSGPSVVNGQPMPIAEIQEGLRTVIVEGDVWARELTTLKDGRFVAVTYLTDYTDSIIIKSFLDAPEDEPINPGDRIKVKAVSATTILPGNWFCLKMPMPRWKKR
jgi:DNA polymerase-3 subunit alpha (Gram-positive type)